MPVCLLLNGIDEEAVVVSTLGKSTRLMCQKLSVLLLGLEYQSGKARNVFFEGNWSSILTSGVRLFADG